MLIILAKRRRGREEGGRGREIGEGGGEKKGGGEGGVGDRGREWKKVERGDLYKYIYMYYFFLHFLFSSLLT